jgi:proteasome lid subunit RPN8/RPN11
MQKDVRIQATAFAAIRADLWERCEIEACGVLLGVRTTKGWEVTEARPLPNIHASPTYFEFDPADLLQLHLTEGERIIGAYHSHPYGPPHASSTDRRQIASMPESDWIWLIFGGPFGDAMPKAVSALAAYRYDGEHGLAEVPVTFVSA